MGKSSGMTRGDQRRNARRERLRGLLPRDGAVIGIDLGDEKQAIAVVVICFRWISSPPTMGIGTSSSSEGAHTPPMRIAYAVNPDARLSWGGLPAPGRDLSSVRPDACHLMACHD